MWINVTGRVPTGRWDIRLAWQNLCWTLQANCSAKLFFRTCHGIGTIDLNHFIPLSVTLTLPGDHNFSAKQNLLPSFFPAHFSADRDERKYAVETIQVEHLDTVFR